VQTQVAAGHPLNYPIAFINLYSGIAMFGACIFPDFRHIRQYP
jgi:hypothetical protein